MYYLPLALIGAPVVLFGALRLRALRREHSEPGPPAPEFSDLLAAEQTGQPRYLFYFFTPRCFPCRRLAPRVDRLAAACAGIIKVDASIAPEVAERFGVTETPTLVLVEAGRMERFVIGATAGGELLREFADAEGLDA